MIPMSRTTNRSRERGQAYTLEGLIGAMIVLMALLFALQSVVITPTTGGAVDRSVQEQQQQELEDALLVASYADDEDNLTVPQMVRYWNETNESGTVVAFEDRDPNVPNGQYDTGTFENVTVLGEILQDRFAESDGRNYNVVLFYQGGDGVESLNLVYQGQPDTNALTASYAVTLFDGEDVTGEDVVCEGTSYGTLGEVHDNCDAPIPNAYPDREVYNVVEVRVVVW